MREYQMGEVVVNADAAPLPGIITIEEFISKVEELVNSDKQWGIHADIDYNRIRLIEVVDGAVVSYWSPHLIDMTSSDYRLFKTALERLMPEPDWVKGRYW